MKTKKNKKKHITTTLIVAIFTCLLITTATFAIPKLPFFKQPQEITNRSDSSSDIANLKEETATEAKAALTETIQTDSNTKYETPKEISYSNSPYKDLYPNLYCEKPTQYITNSKTIYLTFDDGPSQRTGEILDILKAKNVKATFFVIGNNSELGRSMMKRIVDEGHAIAIHTYSHEYKKIYAGVKEYLDDFNKIATFIYETTGVKPSVFRFPGGSNTGFNKKIRNELLLEMTRRGYSYFDWNLCNGDAASSKLVPSNILTDNVLKNSTYCDVGVVLMHDCAAKKTTVDSLSDVVEGLKKQNFKFDILSSKINPDKFRFCKPKLN